MKKLTILTVCLALYVSNCFAQWTTGGTQISFTATNNNRPFVSAAAKGSYYVTWVATDTNTVSTALNKIKIAGYDSTGTILAGWKTGGDTTTHDNGDYYAPQIITCENGNVIVTWFGYAAGSNRSHIYAQKYSSNGVAQWNSGNPVQVSTGTSFIDEYPMVITDRHNGAYLAWTRFDSTIAPSSADVYLQHIDSAGNVAAGWNPNATGVATTKGLREFYPKLSLTPDQSSVYVVYPAGLIGATSLILKKYTATNGSLAAGWSASGVTISTGPNVYPEINHDLSLYADNSNNALVVWVEARYTGNGEIYMQQINPSGAVLLAANGEYLFGDSTGLANGIDYVQVIQEADKNLLIAYNNLVNFNDVAAMKVKPNGTILWNDSLITTGGKSAYPYPALDGKNGVYLFYVNTNSPEKLYALAIDSNGTKYKGWTVPGSLFGTMSDYDGFNPNYDVNATATNPLEAVVAWNRQVGKLFNIYTCNLLSNGSNCQSPNGINEISNTADTYTLFPNPANDNVTVRSNSYEGNKTITIYNIVGQEINTIESPIKEVAINTSQLDPGMYFVTIKEIATNRNYTFKLIKK